MLTAIQNAFYKAVTEDSIDDIPIASNGLDKFNIKSHELGQVLTNTVEFNDHGLKITNSDDSGPQLFYYKDILPDKKGDACGMWYENIVVPEALEIKDTNCCFIWKKVPSNMVHLCSVEAKRCAYFGRILLKKLHHGCEEYFKNNDLPAGEYELPPPVTDSESAADAVDGALRLDTDNGIFKGKLWVFELMKDLTFVERPQYVEFGPDT